MPSITRMIQVNGQPIEFELDIDVTFISTAMADVLFADDFTN